MALAIATVQPSCGGGVGSATECPPSTTSAGLSHAQATDGADGPFVVALQVEATRCTGVLIGPTAILTAGHCLPSSSSASVFVTIGATAENCASGAAPPCGPVVVDVARDDEEDIALLTAASPWTAIAPAALPFLLEDGPLSSFTAFGFGAGDFSVDGGEQSVSVGSALLEAHFVVNGESGGFFDAQASDERGEVCDGDSGGPAIERLDDGTAVLVGVLHDSDGTGVCTPSGGDQTWSDVRVVAAFVDHTLSCREVERAGIRLLDCSGLDRTPGGGSSVGAACAPAR